MKILITGGTSGLGKAIVEKLAQNAEVYFTYFSNESGAKALSNEFNARALPLDLTDNASVGTLKEWISEHQPNVLINNALTGLEQKHAHKISSEAHQEGFEANLKGVIDITNAFLQIARKRKSGKIINVLSAYLIGNPPTGMSQYVAQKAYLLSLNKSWATENIAFGVTSNAISPSIMKTKLTESTDVRIFEQMEKSSPLKRLIQPKEVAEVIEFIASSTPFLNGQNIVLNHGENIH